MKSRYHLTVSAAAFLVATSVHPAIVFEFDYSFDTNNFFDTPAKKSVLEAAGTAISSRLGDTLDAIVPSGFNSWSAEFSHPASGMPASVSNPTISADTIRVYAGGYVLPSGVLGRGGGGGYNLSGTTMAWFDTVEFRGEQANGATTDSTTSADYGLWGGSITFTKDASINWNYTLAAPTVGQADFYSVALHELGHLIGFNDGTPSFARLVNTTANTFTGPTVTTQNGGVPAPLHGQDSGGNNSHFKDGLSSTFPGSTTPQETAMGPTIILGTRKLMTKLDFAALDDIGWDVNVAVYSTAVPEPHEYLAVSGAGLVAFAAWRRRQAQRRS